MLIKSQSIFFIFGLAFFIIDRLIKYLFFNSILANSFFITYVTNRGIAFGLSIPPVIIVLFYILVIIIILFLINWLINLYQSKKYVISFSLWLIILGALSNIIDRIRFGFVIDYIDLHVWPVFNLADTMIVVGVILFLIQYIREEKIENL